MTRCPAPVVPTKMKYLPKRVEYLRERYFRLVVGSRQWKLPASDPGFKGLNLNAADWGFACYLAKRGEMSEIARLMTESWELAGPPPARARSILARILIWGKFKRRGKLFLSDVPRLRSMNEILKKRTSSGKRREHLLAKYYGVSESTVRDALKGVRDFAGS